ncbi:MAG: hypothetical protein RL238_3157, partial [Actinomycetota bacterium]
GPTVVATHRACGAVFVPRFTCSACDAELERSAVRATVDVE